MNGEATRLPLEPPQSHPHIERRLEVAIHARRRVLRSSKPAHHHIMARTCADWCLNSESLGLPGGTRPAIARASIRPRPLTYLL